MAADDGVDRFIGGEAELKRAGEPSTNEAGSTGDDDFHAVTSVGRRAGIGGADLI
jgi:hypothetical protein